MWNLVLLGVASAAVIGGCLVPNRWLPPLPNDKLLHFASFALLSLLALRIADGYLEAALWLTGLFLLGWLIEFLQEMLVPDRRFCWRDLGANAAGIVCVAVCAQLYTTLNGMSI